MPQLAAEGREEPTGAERLLALSDGVFAIAMTLMVLQLEVPKLPDAEAAHVGRYVLEHSGDMLVYVLSFLVVGNFWMAHHRVFSGVAACDEKARWLNLWFLMGVSFLPYPTGLVGEYGDERFPAVFYAGSMAITSLLLTALFRYVAGHPQLLREGQDPAAIRRVLLVGLAVTAVFLLSTPLSLVSVTAAECSWAAIPLVRGLLDRVLPQVKKGG